MFKAQKYTQEKIQMNLEIGENLDELGDDSDFFF